MAPGGQQIALRRYTGMLVLPTLYYIAGILISRRCPIFAWLFICAVARGPRICDLKPSTSQHVCMLLDDQADGILHRAEGQFLVVTAIRRSGRLDTIFVGWWGALAKSPVCVPVWPQHPGSISPSCTHGYWMHDIPTVLFIDAVRDLYHDVLVETRGRRQGRPQHPARKR